MKTINLLDSNDKSFNKKWTDLFIDQLTVDIKNSQDTLKENYEKIIEGWKNYPAFHCLFEGENLVAFGAVQTKNFPTKCCRLLTRAYITSPYRKLNKNTLRRRHSFLTIGILQNQITWARSNGYEEVFVSMQHLKRESFLKRWTQMLNKTEGLGEWSFQEKLFLTCPWPREQSCWQWITLSKLTKHTENLLLDGLKSISVSEYHQMFSQ